MRSRERTYSDREQIAFHLHELLDCLGQATPEEQARCAESTACDLVSTIAERYPGGWRVVLDLIGTAPDPSACGLLTAASLVLSGPDRVAVARRAAAMCMDLPPHEWLDHIGCARPTGRAARSEFLHRVLWLIEIDDGLHVYCLMTQHDLDRDILEWTGMYPSFAELDAREEAEDLGTASRLERDNQLEVPLKDAIAAMTAATRIPGMWGQSTTVEYFGLFVRWHLSRLAAPALANLPMREWQPPRRLDSEDREVFEQTR